MIEFEILARGLYLPAQLVIDYDPKLQMPVTAEIQTWMDDLWEQKLAQARRKGTPLFETPLFRLISTSAQADGTLHITMGATSYKQYVTTRVADFAARRARSELGNPLAVCSVVETSDGFILLDKRQGVDVYVGRYHVIGGFFERHLDEVAGLPDPFGAVRREIREETGIQTDDIQEQYCLGVVYDLAMPHGEMCFLTRLHIPLAEVQRRVPEENEIKQLIPLHVTPESLQAFILQHHGNISATGEPNLLMYGGWKFGEAWFEEMMGKLSA
jgi:8-oxo-dGTP pyrophosphatase MutT (NUDIX family)